MSKVYLIGAGPGDEELITVKAVRMLQKCTAVMYDRLSGTNVLKYLNDDCEVYYCGKEPGCHYKTQEQINDMLVELAKKGHTVGRVKGGDPYIFGRGGEEALRLIEEGIEFEVIPGITSPISVLNYAGIPVTHRKIAQGFHVFTGMSAANLNINWNAAANVSGTLIFLMGFNNLENITRNLIENGMDENTACGVVMSGTTSRQRKVIGTLKNIKEKATKEGFHSPCIIVVGEVVNFNNQLNWFEKKPLYGMNVCVTRSKEQAKEIREKLIDLGAQVTEINSIAIKNTPKNLEPFKDKLSDYDYVVLTSVNGVNSLFDYLNESNFDIRGIKAKFASIGPATSKALRQRGIIEQIEAEKFVGESLFEEMKKHVKKGDKIFIPRSKAARPYLVEALREIGCIVDEAHSYEVTSGRAVTSDALEYVDYVLYTSPSTVRNMISMFGEDNIKSKKAISIGPITGAELEKHHIAYEVCDEYTTCGIINKLLQLKGAK